MIWRSIKNQSIKKILQLSGIGFLILVFGVLVGLFLPYEAALANENQSISDQIKYLYKSDQLDRKSLKSYVIPENGKIVNERDSLRLERAKNIYIKLKNKEVELTYEDKFNIAMILHHGKTQEDYEIAYKLATEVANSNSNIQNAAWLQKATYDRLQLSQGKPQKYGTQY